MPAITSFGLPEVDKLMGGGFLRGSSYLLEVEPGTGEMAFIARYLDEGLCRGEACGVIVYDIPHEAFIDKLTESGVDAKGMLDSGALVIADFWSEGKYDPERRSPILMTDHVNDPTSVFRVYGDLAEINQSKVKSGKFTGTRLAVYSLSSEIMNYKFEPTYKVVKSALNLVRQQNTMNLAVLSPKMFDETVIASFEHLYDGLIILSMKEAKGRFQRYIRIRESPIGGFYTQEVPYDIVDGKPHLLASSHESFLK